MFRKRNHGRTKIAGLNSGNAGCCCANEGKDGNRDEFSLSDVERGCHCRIRRHHALGAVRQRLLDMGLIPDAEVEVMRVAPLGDPIEIKVATSFITLRKREADQIEIINC